MATEKFETSLKKLEEIVRRLEGGSLSLEDSLKAFEEGVKHSSFCAKKLDEAERRVEVKARIVHEIRCKTNLPEGRQPKQ